MLVRGIFTDQITIPHEPSDWMKFRKLSWKQLRVAETVSTDDQIERVRRMGGETFTAITGVKTERDKEAIEKAKARAAEPVNAYDFEELLKMGVAEWSYTEDVAATDSKPATTRGVSLLEAEGRDKALADLDSETVEWAARQIVSFAKKEPTDAEKK